jgi:hypothetical protein
VLGAVYIDGGDTWIDGLLADAAAAVDHHGMAVALLHGRNRVDCWTAVATGSESAYRTVEEMGRLDERTAAELVSEFGWTGQYLALADWDPRRTVLTLHQGADPPSAMPWGSLVALTRIRE